MQEYDFVVIGGGSAGYPAAIYAARFSLKTVVITKERGGLLTTTHVVENYPGFIRLSGPELMQNIEDHVKDYDVPIVDDEVVDIEKDGDYFIVKAREDQYKAKAIVIATGTERRKLDVPGEKEFYGKGVSYCATCDAPLFKGKVIGVVGGSDSAAKEALLLAEYGSKVYIIYRGDQIHPEPINMRRVEENEKIEIIPRTNVVTIKGDKFITHVVLDRPYSGSKELKLGGLFIEIGHLPQSELAKKLGVKLNEKGEIIIDRLSRTNVPGVYAAGDVADMEWKQAITGAAEGCVAAYSAYEYISAKKWDE
ncbi:MAG: FAD-dependent oxidoreductase [Candidatus Aenigmarchaeota archaeon]|nr:FAD-dependent oxidoreductase [Candidatus Aenigmarchaeota archaeon]